MPVSIGFVAEFDAEVGKVRTLIENALPNLETDMKYETANAVDDLVYPMYPEGEETHPETHYVRRHDNGGMSDQRNYYTKIDKTKLSVTLENRTKGNPRYAPPASQGWDPGEISDIIEKGARYHWTHSLIYALQPYPRPYLDEAEYRAATDFEFELNDAYLST